MTLGLFALGGSDAEAAPKRDAEPNSAVTEYRATFEACAGGEHTRLAIRRFRRSGEDFLLTVDPHSLETRIEASRGLDCAPTSDAAQAQTRLMRALQPGAPGPLFNAGLSHGAGGGSFVTGDLCPSLKPMDRDFFARLAKEQPGAPVALAVSGLWLKRHAADFAFLLERAQSGALAITFVNHSMHHPYASDRPDAQTYLLTPGLNIEDEIFGVERLLVEAGATPSAFFRFPGLVSDAKLRDALRAHHLIVLGADAWLALGPAPRPGSILLMHPNGNEPAGLRLFNRLLERGGLARPFRAIVEAPPDDEASAEGPRGVEAAKSSR